MMEVTITECGGEGTIWESRHKTEDEGEAIDRALEKHFGTVVFKQDSGLTKGFGQIMKPCGLRSYTSIRECPGSVRIVAKPV
jgi:hypothetical protein